MQNADSTVHIKQLLFSEVLHMVVRSLYYDSFANIYILKITIYHFAYSITIY